MKNMKNPFTEREEVIMDLILLAHKKYVELEESHPSLGRDWESGIHKLQDVLINRVVIRDYSDYFGINNKYAHDPH